jgi:hypothetical protein
MAKTIVYHCWTGGFAAPVAAAIHLDALSSWVLPPRSEIMGLPGFARTGPDDRGFLFSRGFDLRGREICVAGSGPDSRLYLRTAGAAAAFAGEKPGDYLFVDCAKAVGRFWLAISAPLAWLHAGHARRSFLAWIIQRHYHRMVELVREIQAQAT